MLESILHEKLKRLSEVSKVVRACTTDAIKAAGAKYGVDLDALAKDQRKISEFEETERKGMLSIFIAQSMLAAISGRAAAMLAADAVSSAKERHAVTVAAMELMTEAVRRSGSIPEFDEMLLLQEQIMADSSSHASLVLAAIKGQLVLAEKS